MIAKHDNPLPVIGLEIHVELDTATKMFCRCLNRFGDEPNTHTCPVCIGMPGVLPVMNRRAVDLALKVGLALNCQASAFTKWDRKSYYYPDLPKNYQISQYDLPLSVNGRLEIPLSGGGSKRIGIRRAHLEEDAGKNVHDFPAHTGVDLNRAGVPLLEIVSEPHLNGIGEVMTYARAMQRLVRWLGASQANMQMGQMRFEPNISLWVGDPAKVFDESAGRFTPIFEVKNLNSFRALERTCQWVIDYHRAQLFERGGDWSLEAVGKQNWGYRDDLDACQFQRGKEEAHDYRYFPDPDLAPVVVDDAWRDRLAGQIGELPIARKARYLAQYKLTDKEADALTQDVPTGDLLDAAVNQGASPKQVANILLNQYAAAANERNCTIFEAYAAKYADQDMMKKAEPLVELCRMVPVSVNTTAIAPITRVMMSDGGHPMDIAKRLNLLAVTDASAIEGWVDAAIAANPGPAEQVRTGDKKAKAAFGFLVGAVMKLSGGKAPPAAVKELLEKKLQKTA